MVATLSHYELLGLQPNATEEQIITAYRLMAKSLHPDKNCHGQTLMKLINAAKETLLDHRARTQYDREDLVSHQRGNDSRHGSSSHEVRRLRSELADAQRQLSSTERKCTALLRSQANLSLRVRNLEREKDDVEYELSKMERMHKQLENKYKKLEKKVNTLTSTNQQLEKENLNHVRRIDTYEMKIERISRELREERRNSANQVADAKEKASKKIIEVKKSLSMRSVCYQCDGKATSSISCTLCDGSGAVKGIWTKCHRCNGMGCFSSVDGTNVICENCDSIGAKEGVLSLTCFKCKGNENVDCRICWKGNIRGFNLKLCPFCNGKNADECENCHGRAFVSCECGLYCKGHGAYQISKVASPSSLQRTLTLGNGVGKENSTAGWKAKFLSRNWNVLSLQKDEVKGVFI
jgi:DnaJ-class molecular chaperone